MSNQSSFTRGSNDANSGKGQASTNGMTSQARESYVAGHKAGSRK